MKKEEEMKAKTAKETVTEAEATQAAENACRKRRKSKRTETGTHES